MRLAHTISVVVAIAAAFTLYAMSRPTSNTEPEYQLRELWKRYEAARQKDLPATQTRLLEEIKKEALRQGFYWDFWDAGVKYVSVASSRNWKLRDSLTATFGREINKADIPLLTFKYKCQYERSERFALLDYALSEKKRLEAQQNRAFYSDPSDPLVSDRMEGHLPDYIRTDYEYVMWRLAAVFSFSETSSPCTELRSMLGNSYPSGAYLEFCIADAISGRAARKDALEKLAQKYAGRAVGLFARASLLGIRKSELDERRAESGLGERRATSEAYLALRAAAMDCEKVRSSLTGEDARIMKAFAAFKELADELDSKDLQIFVSDNKLTALLRNLSSVSVTIKTRDGSAAIHTLTADNPARSYYVIDTVRLALPELPDGNYTATASSGKVSDQSNFEKYRMSIAGRWTEEGYGIYVADYKTGKPYEKADLTLIKSGRTVSTVKNFPLSGGFTRIPAEFSGAIKGSSSSWRIKASGNDGVSSDGLHLRYQDMNARPQGRKLSQVKVFTDRGAYNPGDSVSFKAILYGGDPYLSLKVADKGAKVQAALYDTQGNKLDSIDLTTNDFGSVAAAFALPKGLRGGRFSIRLKSGDYEGSVSFRVDEFVLPTYDLSFDPLSGLYLPGDTVRVEGSVTSYSGHSLAAARASYSATLYDRILAEGPMEISRDGRFHLDVPTDSSSNYQNIMLNVKVTDDTGETHDYNFAFSVSKYVSLVAELLNEADAEVVQCDYNSSSMVYGDLASFRLDLESSGEPFSGEIRYELLGPAGETVASGESASGERLDIVLKGRKSGLYRLKAEHSDRVEAGCERSFLWLDPSDSHLDAPVDHFFLSATEKVERGGDISVLMACPAGEVWAVAEVYGYGAKLLDQRTVHIEKPGEIRKLDIRYRMSWPSDVNVTLLYFRNSSLERWSHSYTAERAALDLPLSFSRFEDKTLPGGSYSFGIKTLPGTECLAAVFDKSVDNIARNEWGTVSLSVRYAPVPGIDESCGRYGTESFPLTYSGRRYTKSAPLTGNMVMASYDALAEDASASSGAEPSLGPVRIRSEFANTLAFKPFLRADADGNMSLDFNTSDKLSTYYVSLFAHTGDMRNATLRREMTVTIPVKLSLSQPQYLYVGDKYSAALSVSSNHDSPIEGTLYLYQYDGTDYERLAPVNVQSVKLAVPPGSSSSVSFDVAVPSLPSDIGLKAEFVSEGFSDGLFVSVPVRPAAQTLTESHSAVLLQGMDRNEALERLKAAFVNTDSDGAELKETSIIDMIRDAVPAKSEPASDNLAALLDSYYVRLVAGSLGVTLETELTNEKLLEKILACRNADGGFAWFEGLCSSPLMTALALERFSKLVHAGLALPLSLEASVRFLDKSMFDLSWPYWCGGLSSAQYLYVRSLYPSVPFEVRPSADDKEFSKRMGDFRKWAREYLVPKKARGLEGRILDKARRLRTLALLMDSPEGVALAKAWGLSLNPDGRMRKSYSDDVASLLEYAVNHRDGGVYYPNAVLPFRGLLESEAYAHSMLCDLLSSAASREDFDPVKANASGRVADGIRIWLMLQKETQKWNEDPAFIDAIASVMSGSDEVQNTRVLSLSKTYGKAFSELRASGNGFRIERKFYRVAASANVSASDPDKRPKITEEEILPGTALHIGDKIRADYRIWNQENRSFVRVSVPREASLRPADQLSGRYGFGLRPMRLSNWSLFTPGGYRDVRADRTYYYFDSYSEEDSTISEEFFVTQAGEFSAPVLEIESLYAPHYRANSDFSRAIRIEK